jgi:hypothetical protein
MQAIMETLFDIGYLGTVITLGVILLAKAGRASVFRLFAIATLVLGCGDAFHLVPRAYGLLTDTMSASSAALGLGKLVTSVTMTVFYVLLFRFFQTRYKINTAPLLTGTVYTLAIARIGLCLFPQNDWFSPNSPVSWGIYRNIPFVILGIITIFQTFINAKKFSDHAFRYAWLAILLSFGFYIPVVLWADTINLIGMLMIPKTLCYVWLVFMGYRAFNKIPTPKPS